MFELEELMLSNACNPVRELRGRPIGGRYSVDPVAASRKSTTAHVSPEEKAALEGLRAELERQEAVLKEAQNALREREQFMDESETRLFEKVQSQQEREIELDQREEELMVRTRKFRESEASGDARAAAALKAEDEAAADSDEMRA